MVRDLELVAIPRWDDTTATTLFVTNRLYEEVDRRLRESNGRAFAIKPGTPRSSGGRSNRTGRYGRLYIPEVELRFDVFLATPETWAVALMIRTGSAAFSRAMLTRWKAVSGGGNRRETSSAGRTVRQRRREKWRTSSRPVGCCGSSQRLGVTRRRSRGGHHEGVAPLPGRVQPCRDGDRAADHCWRPLTLPPDLKRKLRRQSCRITSNWLAGTFSFRLFFPSGHRTSTESAFSASPRPKCWRMSSCER